MSDLNPQCQLSDSKDAENFSSQPVQQILSTRDATLGEGLIIRRALPHRERRMIGAWCFLDHFGPIRFKKGEGMNVGPHPHIGLQTFTWVIEGKILHRDSLGNAQTINPGQVNLMTAGKGVVHSEESQLDEYATLHGVQLWIALPDSKRQKDASFTHYTELPHFQQDGLSVTVLAGEFEGKTAPTEVFSPLLGLDIVALEATKARLPLNPAFEYGILVLEDEIDVESETISVGKMIYLGCRREHVSIRAFKGARFILIGGEPFKEEILIWWNYVARTKEEIKQADEQWKNNDKRFSEVQGYQGIRVDSPPIPWK